jgi:UDP-N-acetylglucosamine acyltransferase
VGEHAFITGGTLVRKNVPPYVKAAREPLSYVGINAVGLRRRGFTQEAILQIEDIYRTIYIRGYNVSNAIKIVEHESPNSIEKEKIISFIRESTNGIMRGNLQ